MRHFFSKHRGRKCRSGISFIEIVSSLVIVAMVSGGILAVGNMVSSSARNTASYAKLRIYATDKIEQIEDDLENGMEIDSLDYSESGITGGINADVDVVSVGNAFGKEVYLVSMRLIARGTNCTIKTSTILREGCSTYAAT